VLSLFKTEGDPPPKKKANCWRQAIFAGPLILEDEGTVILQNVRQH